MSKRGASHYVHKRTEMFKQQSLDKNKAVTTDFDEEFTKMQKCTLTMEKSYRVIYDSCEFYLTPKSGDRYKKQMYGRLGVIDANQIRDQDQHRMAEAMEMIGQSFGEDTSLGAIYVATAEAQKDIIHAWVHFQNECDRKYLKPLKLFSKDLNEIKLNLGKLERDKLYLDSQKAKSEKARRNIKNFDPTVVQHYNDKAARLQNNLAGSAGTAQEQMEVFFYELEDDQMFIVSSFVAAQLEYFRTGYEALQSVADFITQTSNSNISSVLGNLRTSKNSVGRKAVAISTFNATDGDELSFLKGDVLTVTNEDVGEGDWFQASIGGESGLIPANFVKFLDEGGEMAEMMSKTEPDEADIEAAIAPKRIEMEQQLAAERAKLEAERAAMAAALKKQQQALSQKAASYSSAQQTQMEEQQAKMLQDMFDSAWKNALAQLASSERKLVSNAKSAQSPSFKPSPETFDQSFEALNSSGMGIMESVKELLSKAYSGDIIQTQSALNSITMRAQEVCLDGKQNASSLVSAKDRSSIYNALQNVIASTKAMINALGPVAGKDKATVKTAVAPHSKKVAGALGELLDAMELTKASQANALLEAQKKKAEAAKQQQHAASTQEAELLEAARKIARVAQELAKIKDKNPTGFKIHQNMVGESQNVTSAASGLVEVATSCQKEISKLQIKETSEKKSMYFDDGTWSDGLVSAATNVAGGVQDLLDSAMEVINCGEKMDLNKVDMLRAVARNIASCTVQVVTASGVKNPNHNLQRDLQSAGNKLQSATDDLIKALNVKTYGGSKSVMDFNSLSATQKRKAELEAQAKILRLERELETAQKELRNIRSQKYKDHVGDDDDDLPPPPEDDDLPPPPPDDDGAPGIEDDIMARMAKLRAAR